jgi:hypothetical protein
MSAHGGLARAIADASADGTRTGAIVAAIVTYDRAGLDPDVQRRPEAGTYHRDLAASPSSRACSSARSPGGWFGRTAMLCAIALPSHGVLSAAERRSTARR